MAGAGSGKAVNKQCGHRRQNCKTTRRPHRSSPAAFIHAACTHFKACNFALNRIAVSQRTAPPAKPSAASGRPPITAAFSACRRYLPPNISSPDTLVVSRATDLSSRETRSSRAVQSVTKIAIASAAITTSNNRTFRLRQKRLTALFATMIVSPVQNQGIIFFPDREGLL